jgi:ESS family glutamate:Na+ symporter
MSLCLTGNCKNASLSGSSSLRNDIWLTLIWTISLGIQGVIGVVVGQAVSRNQVQASTSDQMAAPVRTSIQESPQHRIHPGGHKTD